MLRRALQLANARLPMNSTLFGTVNVSSPDCSKQASPIYFKSDGKSMDFRELHHLKAHISTKVTLSGTAT